MSLDASHCALDTGGACRRPPLRSCRSNTSANPSGISRPLGPVVSRVGRRDCRAPRPQRRRQDDDDQHGARRARADRRAAFVIEGVDLAHRSQRGAGADQFRRGLRAAARQSHRRAEPARLRPHLRGRASATNGSSGLLRRYDLARYRRTKAGVLSSGEQTRLVARQGDAEQAAAPCCSTSRPPRSTLPPRATIRAGIAGVVESGTLRRSVDEPQHGRGRGGLRPGAVPVARPHRARGRSETACPASTASTRSTISSSSVAQETLGGRRAR